jgi:hypothetical protein
VIKRPLKFRSVVIRLILVIIATTYTAVDIENRMAISPLLRGVLIVVILLIEPVATMFIVAKEIAICFILIKVILINLT